MSRIFCYWFFIMNSIDNEVFVKIEFDIIRSNIDNIIKYSVPIFRINSSGKLVVLPPEKLDHYFGGTEISVELYTERKWEERLRNNFRIKSEQEPDQNSDFPSDINKKGEVRYRARRKEIKEMSLPEREKLYNKVVDTIKNVDFSEAGDTAKKIRDVMKLIREAFILSKSSLDEVTGTNEFSENGHIREVARCTSRFVENVMQLLKNRETADALLRELQNSSMGVTVDHMNNVFVTFTTFVYHYNSIFEDLKILKLRNQVKNNYSDHYQRRFPEHNFSSLENVFKGGIKKVSDDELLQFAIGAFLHDIGKLDNISYFESNKGYDRKEIVKHAPMGYNMIVNSKGFSPEVAVIAGLHHEYYGDAAGYGMSRFLFPDKNKKYTSPRYCLTYDISDLKLGIAIGYAPAKMLEVIDVYSALIDGGRKYRERAYTSDEAFRIMEEEFVMKNFRLDPVILYIFKDFVMSYS